MIEVRADGSITGGPWGKKGERHTLPRIWGGWYATKDGNPIHHDSHDFGERGSNSSTLAEYFAIRSALYWLNLHGYSTEPVLVYSDSQVAVRQIVGVYRCNTPTLQVLLDSVLKLVTKFPEVGFKWVRREELKIADALSKALQTFGYVPTWEELLESLQT